MARLIRTEKEVEGRYEDVWIVVDEDALDQWPAGPLKTVGQKVPRVDGVDARPGTGAVHGRPPAAGDAAHGGAAQPVRARACNEHRPRGRARRRRGVRAVIGPADLEQLTDEPGYVGHAVAAVAAETFGQAQAAAASGSTSSGTCSSRCSIRTRRCARSRSSRRCQNYERGDFERGRRRGGRGRRGGVPNAGRAAQLDGDAPGRLPLGGRRDHDLHLDAVHLGHPRLRWPTTLGLPPDKVRVVCHAMGGGFGAKNSPGDYTPIAAELAKRTGRPVKCALTRREENVAAGNRNATIQRLTGGCEVGRDARRARRRLRQRRRVSRAGRRPPRGR